MAQQAGLSWGALQFVKPEADPPEDGYLIHAMANGTTLGNPSADYEVVQSLLRDGALAVRGKRKNRTVQLRLAISAPNAIAGPALAAGEAAIASQVEMDSPPPLVYVPSADDAVTSVFDVVIAEDPEWDTSDGWDLDEVMREVWYFTLTLECLPFVRGEEKVVVPAVPVPPDPTDPPVVSDIDACDSASGWSYPSARWNMGTLVALTSTSGAVVGAGPVQRFASAPPPSWFTVRRPGSISFASSPYLRVTATVTGGTTTSFAVIGVGPLLLSSASATVPGAIDYFYEPSAPVTNLDFQATGDPALPDGATITMRVHHIAQLDKLPPASGTPRQQSRTALVGGSAPTQATIRLYDATPAALGTSILVHSSRNLNWQPPLRKWLDTSSAVTTDSARVSGGRHTLATPSVFLIPANLLTEGTYSLLGLMSVSSGGTLGWQARMVDSAGATTVGSSVVVSGSTELAVTSGYDLLDLAAIPLPVLRAEADQQVELTLTGTSSMTIDEGLLAGVHDGVFTRLSDADSMTWIEIRSPELGAARPSVFGGTGAVGENSVCVDWKCESFGTHEFRPGPIQLYSLTSSSLVSQNEIEYYERNHSHMPGSAAA